MFSKLILVNQNARIFLCLLGFVHSWAEAKVYGFFDTCMRVWAYIMIGFDVLESLSLIYVYYSHNHSMWTYALQTFHRIIYRIAKKELSIKRKIKKKNSWLVRCVYIIVGKRELENRFNSIGVLDILHFYPLQKNK